jgi:predicted dehydrogenase/threonine dehydrogenase-like Zn-dependent dehydrogenase
MLVEFGKANLINKARQQPDKVRQVLDKVRTDGALPTLEAVRSKLDQAIPLGYCNSGTVLEVGPGVEGFEVGDRVASNGQHAEVVNVASNLCARIPQSVDDEAAGFTVIGAVALQAVRLAQPTLGEAFLVTGLGLVGLLTVQILRAQGCRVLGADYDSFRLELARRFGAETVDLSAGEDIVARSQNFSRGRGIDAVIIAAATQSSEPVHQAAQVSRKRGRIVLVGVAGLELVRADFFEKELTFQVSCSYGPGRYDPRYEEGGQDYPIGFVRWTEQRNFEAVLDMIASGSLDPSPLISHRFALDEAAEAYTALETESPLGIVLRFSGETDRPVEEVRRQSVSLASRSLIDKPSVAVIGAGSYATRTLMPAFAKAGAQMVVLAANTGVNTVHAGRKFDVAEVTTDSKVLLQRSDIDAIVIATRHDSHGALAVASLEAGMHVFVEKPISTTRAQLAEVEHAYHNARGGSSSLLLMVGFNRRFSPHIIKMKSLLASAAEPKSILITVNAGAVPAKHWTQDEAVGGGRIIGEACHFIDLARHLAGSPISDVDAVMLGQRGEAGRADDKSSITLAFEDGSFATILYLANGHRRFPKERVEVFCGGRVLQLDNFRQLRGYGWSGFRTMRLWRQDKGNTACVAAFIDALRSGGEAPIPASELFEIGQATFDVVDSLRP